MVFALAVPDRMIPTFAVEEPLGVATALAAVGLTVALLVVAGDRLARRADGQSVVTARAASPRGERRTGSPGA
ncbi:hypothetical protein [Oryzobacter faecalis]|uniref:hypothetical protein n=1 Tax=Oryzobacter faecalis TaxID=3388656 RepID=UPI00398D4AC2